MHANREKARVNLASLRDYACETDERQYLMEKFYLLYLRFLGRYYNKAEWKNAVVDETRLSLAILRSTMSL
jgi:hypothetical protein